MKQTLISILRNKNTSRSQFQQAAQKLSLVLASELSAFLEKKSITIETPIAPAQGYEFKHKIVLVSILRSGIAMLEPFLKFYPGASIGIVGLKRDEVTAQPMQYYCNLPHIGANDNVILLDPMIATGGSGSAALRLIIEAGANQEHISFAAIIASQEGINKIQNDYPTIKLLVAQTDPELNDKKFIVPGLGDFGDRYFGTE